MSKIFKHEWNGHSISQRSDDDFVNLTDMCKAGDRRVSDFLDLPMTKAYLDALARDLNKLPEFLVVKKVSVDQPHLFDWYDFTQDQNQPC